MTRIVLCVYVLAAVFLLVASQAFVPPRQLRSHQVNPAGGWNPFASPPEPTGSPILDAVLEKQTAALTAELARSKTGINARDPVTGGTAMHIIAKKGHYQYPPEPEGSIPRQLIDAGIDMNAKNNDGRTALEVALLSGWQRVAILLLDRGADRSVVTDEVKAKLTCPDCKRVVKQYGL